MKKPEQLFAHLNQAAKDSHRMACGIYSAVINLYFNTGIKVEQNEVDMLVDTAIAKGILSTKYGGGGKDLFLHVYDYVAKAHPELKYEIFTGDMNKYINALNNAYMVRIGISVNRAYAYDSQDDGEINEIDYTKLRGNIESGDILNHFTNIFKGLGRFAEGEDKDKKFIWDSYFGRKAFNQYQVGEGFSELIMPTCYYFYVD